MRVIKILLVFAILLALVVGVAVIRDLQYPTEWDQIHLGMSGEEVNELIGPGVGEWPGWSGAFWNDRGLLIRNQLELYIDPFEGVTIISIKRLSIFPEHRLSTVRAEYSHPAEN